MKKPKPDKKSVIVQVTKVRMQKELKDKLERSAARNNRTHNGELVHRLEQSFLREEGESRENALSELLRALAPERKSEDGGTEIDGTELAKRFAALVEPSRDSHLSRYLSDYLDPNTPRRARASDTKTNPKSPTEE